MRYLLESHLSWYSFLLITLVIVIVYQILKFVHQRVPILALGAADRRWLQNFFRRILLFYVPVASLVIITLFWLISPLWDGVLILLVTAIFFPLIRNYWTGILFQYDNNFRIGKGILVGTIRGDINKMNALGIFIMTPDGIQYFSYTHIQKTGFSLVADNDTKEYCYLNIHPMNKEISKQTPQKIMFRLLQVPYLDPSFSPTFMDQTKENKIQIKVLLRPGGHKKEIIDLIETWNYHCTLSY